MWSPVSKLSSEKILTYNEFRKSKAQELEAAGEPKLSRDQLSDLWKEYKEENKETKCIEFEEEEECPTPRCRWILAKGKTRAFCGKKARKPPTKCDEYKSAEECPSKERDVKGKKFPARCKWLEDESICETNKATKKRCPEFEFDKDGCINELDKNGDPRCRWLDQMRKDRKPRCANKAPKERERGPDISPDDARKAFIQFYRDNQRKNGNPRYKVPGCAKATDQHYSQMQDRIIKDKRYATNPGKWDYPGVDTGVNPKPIRKPRAKKAQQQQQQDYY